MNGDPEIASIALVDNSLISLLLMLLLMMMLLMLMLMLLLGQMLPGPLGALRAGRISKMSTGTRLTPRHRLLGGQFLRWRCLPSPWWLQSQSMRVRARLNLRRQQQQQKLLVLPSPWWLQSQSMRVRARLNLKLQHNPRQLQQLLQLLVLSPAPTLMLGLNQVLLALTRYQSG